MDDKTITNEFKNSFFHQTYPKRFVKVAEGNFFLVNSYV